MSLSESLSATRVCPWGSDASARANASQSRGCQRAERRRHERERENYCQRVLEDRGAHEGEEETEVDGRENAGGCDVESASELL